jgi:hypothetical protein
MHVAAETLFAILGRTARAGAVQRLVAAWHGSALGNLIDVRIAYCAIPAPSTDLFCSVPD